MYIYRWLVISSSIKTRSHKYRTRLRYSRSPNTRSNTINRMDVPSNTATLMAHRCV